MEWDEASERAEAVVAGAQTIISACGGRAAGSEAETTAQRMLLAQMRALPHATDAHEEPFRVAPHAFMAFEPVLAVCGVLAVACFWARAAAAAWALAHLGLAAAVLELGLYREFLDPLFPTRVSRNVLVRIPPANASGSSRVQRRIIVGGHADSAYEWRINPHPAVLWLAHFAQVGAALVVAATTYAPGLRSRALLAVHGACAACLLTALLNTAFGRAVPGASDNLSGALATLELARHFAQDGMRLAHTELVALVTGAEEAGLRGAKAFARTHAAELVGAGVETLFLGLETLAEPAALAVAHRELNGLVRCDTRAVDLVCRAARDVRTTPLPRQAVYCGATDAAALAQLGVAAVTLEGMSPGPANYYHTRRDTVERMSPACIRDALLVASRAVQLFDAHGLAVPPDTDDADAVLLASPLHAEFAPAVVVPGKASAKGHEEEGARGVLVEM